MTQPILSIIIPFYRRIEYLKQTVEKLDKYASQICETLEVIVVDSHTADDNLASMAAQYYGSTNIIFKDEHTVNNLAAKRNYGIKFATSNFLIFIDDDCIPDTNFIFEYLSLAGSARATYCGVARFDLIANRSNYYRFRHDLESVNDDSYNSTGLLSITSARAMNFGISKSLFLEQNLFFDEAFTGYGWEDIAFFSRVKSAGISIYPCKASVLHLDNTNIINFVRKNISSGVWFTYFYQNYPLAAKSLTITKFYSLRWLSPLVLPVLFILKIGLVAILSLSDKYSFLYSKLIYRLLYSVSFIYGFCLYFVSKKLLVFSELKLS